MPGYTTEKDNCKYRSVMIVMYWVAASFKELTEEGHPHERL